jgi:peptidoglycan/xylan/chitin deacetylase (PgdA/CDA1 family)
MIGRSIADRVRNALAKRSPMKTVCARRSRGVLSVSFDDFPKTAWTVGGTILRQHEAQGTYFVSGSHCGQWFDGQQQYDDRDLQELHEAGHEVGSHLYEHLSVLRLSRAKLHELIVRNDDFVRERLKDVHMTSFAYPYGDASLTAKRICARSFAVCRGIFGTTNGDRVELAQLSAVGLERRSVDTTDWSRLIHETAARKSWLVVFTHDVDENASPFGCRPKELDRLLLLARSAGIDIMPIKSALAQVS